MNLTYSIGIRTEFLEFLIPSLLSITPPAHPQYFAKFHLITPENEASSSERQIAPDIYKLQLSTIEKQIEL